MDKVSFNAYERELEPAYRDMIDKAESTVDIHNFFERTALDFLQETVGDRIDINPESITFAPDSKQGYKLSPVLIESSEFQEIVEQSDLANILERLTERAVKRYIHLDRKLQGKTEAKINQPPGFRS
ncbi:hypothetical protein SAMN05660337_1730 [Maridesulfovibrio ferrireducens]|uniref:Uncharacterized protein n=1 Tax=Maridesulfovibrio ferrireducens TaxID=246191 RepID=A0A1G9FW57_9BACT|nr:hypothetical protein [Maridesulfovibrio ferrireducens]SDK92624.1 hypothetical protein SAMN05660337_1730 [Maridesulfovibrio ferrireducens]